MEATADLVSCPTMQMISVLSFGSMVIILSHHLDSRETAMNVLLQTTIPCECKLMPRKADKYIENAFCCCCFINSFQWYQVNEFIALLK